MSEATFTVQRHYLLVDAVEEERVSVLGVVHTARQWPPLGNQAL